MDIICESNTKTICNEAGNDHSIYHLDLISRKGKFLVTRFPFEINFQVKIVLRSVVQLACG